MKKLLVFHTANNTQKTNTDPNSSVIQPSVEAQDINSNLIDEAYLGQWIIDEYISLGNIGTLSPTDTNKFLGKTLTFSKAKASPFVSSLDSLNVLMENPTYSKEIFTLGYFIKNNTFNTFQVTPHMLGISHYVIISITARDTSGKNNCNFYVKSRDSLILCD